MDRRVALESTVIAHGLPFPRNIEIAAEMEREVQEKGGIPKTIAIINGRISVGLSPEEISLLGRSENVMKVGTAEIAYATALKKNAATTVSATMAIAKMNGISVFSTGGIGGVHRDIDWDVSQDIIELSKTDIVVISAGVKSILDVQKTLEFLETFQVTVVGYKTDYFPLFHCKDSPYRLNLRVDSPEEVEAILKEKRRLGLSGGILLANPIPATSSIEFETLESLVSKSITIAKRDNVSGKALTPYLLEKLSSLSEGRTLEANIALLKNNAALGGEIASRMGRER